MKRELIFVLVFILFFGLTTSVYAAEIAQAEEGYSCLESRVSQTGCSALSFNEKLFTNLAIEECTSELSSESSSNQCWPKSGCTIKSTAQTILALNDEIDTTTAEKWLLSRTAIPTTMQWYLEIEILEGKSGICTVKYPGSTRQITVNIDKTINGDAGSYLTRSPGNYWLEINRAIYNQDINVSCDKDFLTTLLFRKTNGDTIHVSSEAIPSNAGGEKTERVRSRCFGQNTCDYEGSLWATFVLYLMGDYDEEIQDFMPYLIAMEDDDTYEMYLPESFLYFLTGGDFKTELLIKQRSLGYWSDSGKPYYDTAVALLPFGSDENLAEKSKAIQWLLNVQQRSGCWNNNVADTAFILYSIWPRENSVNGRCQDDSQCIQGDCEYSSCVSGSCIIEGVGCENNDGCCPGGCTIDNDNDCEDYEDIECTTDGDCPDDSSGDNYCYGDVYQDVYDWYCDTDAGKCSRDITEEVVEECTGSQVCDEGTATCKTEGGEDECNYLKGCKENGYKCDYDSNTCVPDIICQYDYECGETSYSTDYCMDDANIYRDVSTYFCDLSTVSGECYASEDPEFVSECTGGEECKDGVCEMIEGDLCGTGIFDKKCDDGYICENGYCVPEPICELDDDCPYEECKEATCDGGVCFYNYVCTDVCNIDDDCNEWETEPIKYCGGDDSSDVYIEYYNYTCQNKVCVENTSNALFEDCNGQQCYVDECYGPEPECEYDYECPNNGEICDEGYCVEPEPCDDDTDCYYQKCVSGECIPYECTLDTDCDMMANGKCVGDECIYDTISCDGYGYCYPQSVCENNYGTVLSEYFCNSELDVCCNSEIQLKSCVDELGILCYDGAECIGGSTPYTSDTGDNQVCCVGGSCETIEPTEDCEDNYGTCKSSCDEGEDEEGYFCEGDDSCCVAVDEPEEPKRGWILIVILLILIILAVVGIVFRDKLRTEWIKIKDKFSGKKEKKKFDMPTTMHPIPTGRILPRRILPPGQSSTPPSRLPLRPAGQVPATSQTRPQPSTTAQPAKTSTSSAPTKATTPAQQSVKKSEEKPKNNELDDVLKKLKDMGTK
ncbi:MAG: hypothetical protein ACP5NZ_05245 [Nanobdellota archaeon]